MTAVPPARPSTRTAPADVGSTPVESKQGGPAPTTSVVAAPTVSPVASPVASIAGVPEAASDAAPGGPEPQVVATEAAADGATEAVTDGAIEAAPDGEVDAAVDPRVEHAVAALMRHFATSPPRLGAFPGTAARILQVFREVDPDFNRVVHELQQDAAAVTKLLHIANSAFFGGGGEVDDVRGAVLRIGMRDVAQIALGVAGQSLFEPSSRSAFSLVPAKWNELFHNSMSSAFATSWLSQVARVGRSDHAFLAGLLHDIGHPTALRGLAQLVIEGELDRDVLEVTDAVLDRIHVEVGRTLTTVGGLPDYLCAAAALHHEAEVPLGPEHAELHLVRIIDAIAAKRRGALTPALQDALERSSTALSLDPRWTHVAVNEYETLASQVTKIFQIPDPFAPSAAAAAAR